MVAKLNVRLKLQGMVEARGCSWVRLSGDRCLDSIFGRYRLDLTVPDPLLAKVIDKTDCALSGWVELISFVRLGGSMNSPRMDILFFSGLGCHSFIFLLTISQLFLLIENFHIRNRCKQCFENIPTLLRVRWCY